MCITIWISLNDVDKWNYIQKYLLPIHFLPPKQIGFFHNDLMFDQCILQKYQAQNL